MFKICADGLEQILMMSFSLHVDEREMKSCVEETKKGLVHMAPGFRLLTDLSGLELMDSSCTIFIGEIMSLCNEKQVNVVARVIPDPNKDVGFNIMSHFHYSDSVKYRTFNSLEEAVQSLALGSTDSIKARESLCP